MNYTKDYRRNLTLYWQQYYSNWKIPKGYHVHHIKPKCTFVDSEDPRIHHPSNLIALHPDDHVSIHKCRGDTQSACNFIAVGGREFGYTHSALTKRKIGDARVGVSRKPFTDEHKRKMSESCTGKKKKPWSDARRAAASKAMKERWLKRKLINTYQEG